MVRLNPNDLRRFYAAIDRLARRMVIEKNDHPMYSAIDYVNRLHKNIVSQKYAGTYRSYSDKYTAWKEKYYPGAIGFWHLRGYLLKSLKPFKSGEGWLGGIRGDTMVPGVKGKSPENLSDIGHRMEYGTGRQPPRPLFRPTLEEFVGEGWITVTNRTVFKMKATWI